MFPSEKQEPRKPREPRNLENQEKIPKRETLGPVELVFKNKGRNYGHFERVKVEKRDKNWQKAFSKKVEVMTHRQKT